MSKVKSSKPFTPSAPPDVEARVAYRRRQLIDELIEHKKSSRVGASYAISQLEARLSDLAYIVKHDVCDGWSLMSPGAKRKVEEWIAR
ncbi:MAG TPA: hypothetical protein VIV11_38855 [Kofleriaceae bacterium]